MNIYPTHSCFDDAVDNIIWLMEKHGRNSVLRFRIVHAIIHPSDEPEPMGHAWIETADLVYFSGIIDGEKVLVEASREEYYANANVKKAVRYTLFEAYAEEKRRGHYGPWDEEIKPLCGRTVTGSLIFRPRKDQYQDN